MADKQPPSRADVTEYGSFNLPEPRGFNRPVVGLLYLYLRVAGKVAACVELSSKTRS
jgi:hypothetical protein